MSLGFILYNGCFNLPAVSIHSAVAALQRLLGLVVKVWRNSLCHNVACVFCLCRAYLSECKGNKNMLIQARTCDMGPARKPQSVASPSCGILSGLTGRNPYSWRAALERSPQEFPIHERLHISRTHVPGYQRIDSESV